MVQFCCGNGDCSAAGIPNLPPVKRSISSSVKFDRRVLEEFASSGGGARSLRFQVNGTEIEPIYIGKPQVTKAQTTPTKALFPRDGACKGDWVADEGKADYTRPADNAQIVSDTYTGPTDVQITKTRTEEYSTTFEANLGFADILSLGVSFSSTFTESESTSEAATYHVDENQTGYVVWNSFLRCSTGQLFSTS